MGNEKKDLDGVTLIANAIRKERQENADARLIRTESNVTDVTAQFTTGRTVETETPTDGTTGISQNVVKTTDDSAPKNVVETTNETTNN